MNNENQHIPQGYKDSPLGIIPEDWEVKRLGDFGSFKNGLNFTSNEEGFSYYFLGVGDFQDKTDVYANELGQIRLAKEIDKDYHLKDDDLVFVRSNGSKMLVGRCVVIHVDQVKATYSGFCIRFRPTSEDTSAQYVKHVIDAGYLRRFLQYEGRGTNITNLNQEILGRLPFPLPTCKEQQNILNLLSLWDTAISKQTALIEKLTVRKRGLMQQLLTGKKRLKGFEGEWKEVKLGEIARITMGQSPDSKYYNEIGLGLPLIQGNADIQDRKSIQRIWTSNITKTCEVDDIIMSVRAPVGEIARSTQKSCIGRGVCAIRNTGIEKEYLYQLLLSEEDSWKNIEQGGTFTAINSNEIQKKTVVIPTKNEQNSIASVLVSADKEIEIQKQKLTSLQEQKKGLMQVLLSGKKRVK